MVPSSAAEVALSCSDTLQKRHPPRYFGGFKLRAQQPPEPLHSTYEHVQTTVQNVYAASVAAAPRNRCTRAAGMDIAARFEEFDLFCLQWEGPSAAKPSLRIIEVDMT